eukprot:c5420_g1_i1.p1 GENE.c5420_g1_i1~~c5420_g1_i1.p1  ORF type:complete len:460 (-),score=129.66 c5420_g1_i1:154-1434(-)
MARVPRFVVLCVVVLVGNSKNLIAFAAPSSGFPPAKTSVGFEGYDGGLGVGGLDGVGVGGDGDGSISSQLSQKLFSDAFDDAMGNTRPTAPGDGGSALRRVLTDAGSGNGADFINGYLQSIVDGVAQAGGTLVNRASQGTITGEGIAQRGGSPVGAYGYDFFNPGQSPDPWQLRAGQSDACTSLEESWLRLCSAPPPSVFLEEESQTFEKPQPQLKKGPKMTSLRGHAGSSFLEVSSKVPEDAGYSGPVSQLGSSGKMVLPGIKNDVEKFVLGPRYVASQSTAASMPATVPPKILGPSGLGAGTKPSHPFGFEDLFPVAPGSILPMTFSRMRESGTKKLREQAMNMKDSAAVAMTKSKGLKGGLMGTMSSAMGFNYPVLMGPLTRGPEYYDNTGPLGPDMPMDMPQEERCTVMMNTWLYKCNLIPF